MWRKLWRWLKQIYQSLQQRFQKPEPPPPPRQIPDIEFETKFRQLLEAVANGATGGEIQALRMTTNIKESEWIPWLQRFGERLQDSPETHGEIALRLVQFGQLHRGELGKVAERIGRQILAQIPPPVVEVEQTGNVQHKHEVQKWYQQGIDQYNRGNFVDAIASFNEAIHLQPDFHKAYYRRGITQANVGQYEDAIASYNQAIRFKDDFSDAYHRRGIVLCDVLGQYEDAIASFNAAIRFKRDFPLTYYNLGVAQVNLGRYEDAIASFDSALTLKPDEWLVWGIRGVVAGRVETRNSPYLPSAFAIQNPDLNERGLKGEMASYQEGLKYCPKDTHPEGWGMLNFRIGNAYYNRSRQNPKTRHQDTPKAHNYYNLALETLTETAFPEAHLEVLRRLIRLLLGWNQTGQVQELKRRGTDVLRRLVEKCASPSKQRQLTLEFTDFNQLTVDLWVQKKDVVQALEVAEAGKNACLSWLLDGRADAVAEPSWQQIRQLLQSQTAVVYWHLSPYALTTFILKPGEDEPRVLRQSQFQDQSGYQGNLLDLETWIEEWNQAYSRDKGSKTSAQSTSWRESLPQQLYCLAKILQISAILEELEGCQGYHRLILIPHKDLHRLPLHALFFNSDGFPQSCAITYLPSAAFGLSRLDANPSNFMGSIGEEESLQPNEEPPQPPLAKGGLFSSILSIENPKSLIKDRDGSSKSLAALPAADAESEMISRLFPVSTRLGESDATKSAVIAALQQSHTVIHFTGHGEYESAEPLASKLFLSGEDRLQVKDIIKLNLHSYQLISLSACETAVTGNPTITSEYVGLTSAFLRSGVGSVLSTLWQVQSDASTLFALYFYQQLQQGHPYPVAFTATQKWLKSVTKEDLSLWCQQQIEELDKHPPVPRGIRRCFTSWQKELDTMEKNPPFADPYDWASFTLYGL
ncbi:CHAT domain-containing protein [Laspinema olomoucense]|uniref:CHAT domain-containing protein n=1 Tax=Laspinema olomoucense TaxID=3231600 RepID=UPI0021BB8841|nr:CHAT domain-containing protein [Laspinema sp. D3c]MCT7992716.1 CHAT domain-containing protein [Laspinema sp. D3c]